MANTSRISDFRQLDVGQRRDAVAEQLGVDVDALAGFDGDALGVDAAGHLIENVVGVMGIPVGIATNMVVNGREVLVPMATEEASVVAAASNAAKIARARGGFTTSSTAPLMQAQIQVTDAADPHAARLRLLAARTELMALANAADPKLSEVGGGVADLSVRVVDGRYGTYVVVHLVVDVRDAMGANAVNTMAETVADEVARIADGRVVLRILTNKADRRLARASAVLAADALGGPDVVEHMVQAADLAAADPYRAATHNKGIMNGVSAVVLATGNDTRAVEAGAHSHAIAPDGRYTALSTYERTSDGDLAVSMELPMPVGLVGGATRTHPAAQAALTVAEADDATQLAELIVAVGLAQNIAAVRVLATEGVQRGHMSLHAKNVAIAAGATGDEVAHVAARLVEERAVRHDRAEAVLGELRRQH